MTGWPPAYHQPDPQRECSYYALAYICRCLGHPEVTAQDIMAWRAEHSILESYYPVRVLAVEWRHWWQHVKDAEARRLWYMGQDGRPWVEQHLRDGYIGLGNIHRIPTMHHCVAVLECSEAGVLLMDPVAGFVTEPWDWFLGIGPGTHGCHRIEAWYRKVTA